MPRCRVDNSLTRHVVDGFAFPLGVYPVEEMTPRQGYTVWFEPADSAEESGGGIGDAAGDAEGAADEEEGEWEEWPDRYVFDIAISATRVEALTRALLALMPGRVYPILDVLGQDAYREVDSFVSYELVGQERIMDAVRRFRGFFFEDGMVGFGAMTEEPFMYVFVDEHKLVTVRVETDLKERVEAVLATFDLEEVEQIAGADATAHEHRTVLEAPLDRPDLLNVEEIVEELQDEWGLVLNVPPHGNVDDEENELGITGWRCLLRWDPAEEPSAEGERSRPTSPPPARRYAEVLLTAGSMGQAEALASEALRQLLEGAGVAVADDEEGAGEEAYITMDRVMPADFRELVARHVGATAQEKKGRTAAAAVPELPLEEEQVWAARWLE